MPLQLQLRRIDFTSEPPPLSELMWDVIQTDLCARALLLLLKTLLALLSPASAARRLRRVYAAVEAFGTRRPPEPLMRHVTPECPREADTWPPLPVRP